MSEKRVFLFAALRIRFNETNHLIMVNLKTGSQFREAEHVLSRCQVRLGDFVQARIGADYKLSKYEKTEHTSRLTVKVDQDVAYIEKIRGKLVTVGNLSIFQCPPVTDAICRQPNLQPGRYTSCISLLFPTMALDEERCLYFEATDVQETPKLTDSSQPKIHGRGFQPDSLVTTRKRAVVLSISPNQGHNSHFLWLPDEQTASRFVSQEHELEKGHFFEGVFKKKDDKWECVSYEKAIDLFIEGALSNSGQIYFIVDVEDYKPAKSKKYAEVSTKYFGTVFDVFGKLDENTEGKKRVKIQRNRIKANNPHIWTIAEVIN